MVAPDFLEMGQNSVDSLEVEYLFFITVLTAASSSHILDGVPNNAVKSLMFDHLFDCFSHISRIQLRFILIINFMYCLQVDSDLIGGSVVNPKS